MRTLSRHLPSAPQPRTTMLDNVVGIFSAVICLLIVGYLIYERPVVVLVTGTIIAIAIIGFVFSARGNTRFEKMMSERVGEDICSFRKGFNLREVDPWIVRAVYEEVLDVMCVGIGKVNYALRATDRLVEDLLIDPDELEDVAKSVAARAGYDFSDIEQNPLKGKVQTVGDLVMFFTHQRRLRS